MRYVVYCDESRHDCADHAYMAIGGLWIPQDDKEAIGRAFRDLLRAVGLRAEVKWQKVSRAKLDSYRRLIDFFVAESRIRFCAVVVEQWGTAAEKLYSGDRELGFYQFYYQMLFSGLTPGNEYLILLDNRRNKGVDRYKTLRTHLERAVRGASWISDLTVVDSAQSPLAQLCDLLTGSVAASWCNDLAPDSPKRELAKYLATLLGRPSLGSETEGNVPAAKFALFRPRSTSALEKKRG